MRGWIRDAIGGGVAPASSARSAPRPHTDAGLLADAIVPNLGDRDFFIRKAIGWALRQHARTDPDWVRRFVATHRGQLSPLSYREATRHL